MKLYAYEMKKLCRKPLFIFAAFLIVIIPLIVIRGFGVYTISGCFNGSNTAEYARKQAFDNGYASLGGTLTQEKFDKINSGYNMMADNLDYYMTKGNELPGEFGEKLSFDYQIYTELYYQAEYINNYYDDLRGIISQAQYTIDTEKDRSNPDLYIISANKRVIECYNRALDLKVADHRASNAFFSLTTQGSLGNGLYFLYLIFIVLMCSTVFSNEHECGVYSIIYSSLKGRRSSLAAKCTAVMSVCVLTAVLSVGTTLIYLHAQLGFDDWSLPIQNLQVFHYCPFSMTVGQMIMLIAVLRILCFLFTGALCILCSVISKRSLFAMFISIAVILSITVLSFTVRGYAASSYADALTPESFDRFNYLYYRIFDFIMCFMPTCLLRPDCYLFQFDCINIFGAPVYSIVVIVCAVIIEVLVILALAGVLYLKPLSKARSKNDFRHS